MTTEATNNAADAPRDFVELTEDVSGSPLWNRDLAPTTIREPVSSRSCVVESGEFNGRDDAEQFLKRRISVSV